MRKLSKAEWHKDHDDLVSLAEWLDDEFSTFNTVRDAIRYFEKPWKWDREYHLWQMWCNTDEGNTEVRERITEAVLDGETTACDVRAEMEEQEA